MTASDTREALRAELEATRIAFHELLDRVPPALYDTPSDNPAWTVGQVLFHMSLAPRLLIQDVRLITKQSWLISMISKLLPRALFDWLNKHYTRFGARHPSHDFFASAYNEAHAITLRALDAVTDVELGKGVVYPGWDPLLAGEVTVARLFHYVKIHFEAHAQQIEEQIKTYEQNAGT